jgi:hypothetical protein
MIKYRADVYLERIVAVDVEKETDHFVWVKGAKCAKNTRYTFLCDTWQEAQDVLVRNLESRVLRVRSQLDYAERELSKAKALKEEG